MIELRNISMSYDGKNNVIKNLDLKIEKGELVVLIGESGCGKTTTMKMLNRLIDYTSGEILIDGKCITTIRKRQLRLNMGYVIQNVGLFPNLTIEKNIAIVPKLCKVEKDVISKKVKELMNTVNLPYDQYSNRYPRELSGGQQQRVGVARALANEPDIILMDEPFSALDPITKEQLQNELLRLQDDMKKTIIFVTHDIDEAIKLGDKIAVMNEGEIIQYDTPENILKNPKNEFVENFIGKDRLWKSPEYLTAKDVMKKKFVKIGKKRNVPHAIEVMKSHSTDLLVVVDNMDREDEKVLGVVGINRLYNKKPDSTVEDFMKTDFIKIYENMSLSDVLSIRKEKKLSYNIVLNEQDKAVGVISNVNIINVLADLMPDVEVY